MEFLCEYVGLLLNLLDVDIQLKQSICESNACLYDNRGQRNRETDKSSESELCLKDNIGFVCFSHKQIKKDQDYQTETGALFLSEL